MVAPKIISSTFQCILATVVHYITYITYTILSITYRDTCLFIIVDCHTCIVDPPNDYLNKID